MKMCSEYLAETWNDKIDKETMIVRPGFDFSTWNTMPSAYNNARVNWLACLTALGAEEMLNAACPGKVMRVMAADLYWYRSSGGDVDPNTLVWATLPMPWEVISGARECPRADVADACRVAGLDPQESGWTAPRRPSSLQPPSFEFTPELVHGVTVASPEWAALLRRAGVFSGKKLTTDPELLGDAGHGLAEGVVLSELPKKRPTV